ncbi:SdpI family protein [Chitinophaga sp.]|uniref:SdpI family protein n=1 Tax=Chitinophaga sp. TaxID=1869181 RepID=UPI002F92ABA6
MQENKWWKEIPLIVVIICPFLVYLYLKPLLPDLIPSHYSIHGNGKLVVDGRMSPLRFIVAQFASTLVVYGSMALTFLLTKRQQRYQGQSALLIPILYTVKAGLVILLSAIPIYEMLVAAGKLTAGNATLWAYAGGIGAVVLMNVFIYRIYSVMYLYSDEKPLAHKSYVIIWVSTHVVVSIGPLCALLAGHITSEKIISQFILAFLAICGNLLYNVRPNLYLGIRTPWTLKNETVWRKTHRMGGILLFVFGLAGLIATFLVNAQQVHYILLSVIAIISLIPTAYSYILYKKIIHQP